MTTSSINELLSIGHDTAFHIKNIATVHVEYVATLQGQNSETEHWLEVSGSRTMQNESIPFGTNKVYVPARFAGIEPLSESTNISVFQAIEQAFEVSVCRVTQMISVVQCPKNDACIMGIAAGTAVLQIDATLFVEDDILKELSVARFDPARFRLSTDVAIE